MMRVHAARTMRAEEADAGTIRAKAEVERKPPPLDLEVRRRPRLRPAIRGMKEMWAAWYLTVLPFLCLDSKGQAGSGGRYRSFGCLLVFVLRASAPAHAPPPPLRAGGSSLCVIKKCLLVWPSPFILTQSATTTRLRSTTTHRQGIGRQHQYVTELPLSNDTATMRISGAIALLGIASIVSPKVSAFSAAYSATDLLYQDQQDARARRAAVEADLLGPNIKPLKAPKAKKAPVKRGSGFGAASSDKRKPAQRLAAQQRKIVDKDGVLRIDHALDGPTCDRLREYVLRQQRLADEETEKNLDVSTEYYGVENRRKARCDLLLSLVADENADEADKTMIPDVLNKILGDEGTLRPIYDELVGPDGEFYEFATVITNPGSDRQQVHPDLPHRRESPHLCHLFGVARRYRRNGTDDIFTGHANT